MGGQVDPISIVGDSLEWKNVQKIRTKNRILQNAPKSTSFCDYS